MSSRAAGTRGTTPAASRRTARSTSAAGAGTVYTIVNPDTGEVIGTADEHRAFGTLHPGAVYLHMGEQFLVRELDLIA